MKFLSDRSVEMHREYLNALLLRYRIFEKSYKELIGSDIEGILRARIPLREREEAARLYSEILAHRIFFSSFSERNTTSEQIKREYGSVASFLYGLFSMAKDFSFGFLCVYEDKGRIVASCERELLNLFKRKRVLLAVDLYEHVYFYDYGFKKEEYLMSALQYLDLTKADYQEKSNI